MSSKLDRSVNKSLNFLLNGSKVTASRRAMPNLTEGVGAYTSAQVDPVGFSEYLNNPGLSTASQVDSLAGTAYNNTVGGVIGVVSQLLGYVHADKAAQVAYQRQNDFYDNHLSMPAKVAEYEEAGLNPMALCSSGPGATSAPSVQQGSTPDASGFVSILSTLLDYKLKSRELDIADRRVDVDSKRVSLEEQRLPSLVEQSYALAENRRKQVEWYDATISKMSKEIELMDAHISKVFAETDKVSFESMLLETEGKYRSSELYLKIQNLAKDLGVKDSVISKNDAETALAWAREHVEAITAEYQGALMQSQTASNTESAAYHAIQTACEQFRLTYRSKHAGTDPPSGVVGSLVSICAQMARELDKGLDIFGSHNYDINPNW